MTKGFLDITGISERIVLVTKTQDGDVIKEGSWEGTGRLTRWDSTGFSIETEGGAARTFLDEPGTEWAIKMKTRNEGAIVVYRRPGGKFRAEGISPETENFNQQLIGAIRKATGEQTVRVIRCESSTSP